MKRLKNLSSIGEYIVIFMLIAIVVVCSSKKTNAASVCEVNSIFYSVDESNVATVISPPNNIREYEGEIVIPEKITFEAKEYPVTKVQSYAFANHTKVTKVSFPSSCLEIDSYAFTGCIGLTDVTFPETLDRLGTEAFKGCVGLRTLRLPGMTIYNNILNDAFSDCAGLESVSISPSLNGINNSIFSGCNNIKQLIIEDGTSSFWFYPEFFSDIKDIIEEIYYGRNCSNYPKELPMQNLSMLKKLTIGSNIQKLDAFEFMNNKILSEVVIKDGIEIIPEGCFRYCYSLKTLYLPMSIKEIHAESFHFCKISELNLPSKIEIIGDHAFCSNWELVKTNFPSSLKFIGKSGFNFTRLEGLLTLPEGLIEVGEAAFCNTKCVGFSLPSTLIKIGDYAFADCVNNKGVIVSELNPNYKSENGALLSKDGKTIYSVPVDIDINNEEDLIYNNESVEIVAQHAFSQSKYNKVNLPNLKEIKDFGFSLSSIKNFTLKGNVKIGSSILNQSKIENIIIEEGIKEIPPRTFNYCENLKEVSLPKTITSIKEYAFYETAIKSIRLGRKVNFIESCFNSNIEEIICENPKVPFLNGSVFDSFVNTVTLKVATDAVEAYSVANGWSNLNIIGDPTISNKPAIEGCPSGIYFVAKGGNVFRCSDNKIEDTGIFAGYHAFQLSEFDNYIYVSNAGKLYAYVNPPEGNGDGDLFRIACADGDGYYKLSTLNNFGGNAFEDFYMMYIDKKDKKLYVTDRNSGIRVVDAYLFGGYGSQEYFVKNEYLPYYGNGIGYGALCSGLQIDSNGVFWQSFRYSGNLLCRYKKSKDVPNKYDAYPFMFLGSNITAFYLDEDNGYFYAYLWKSQYGSDGIYRASIADLISGKFDYSKLVLVDNSPVLNENHRIVENILVTQITGDGDNIYWSYNAPKSANDEYVGDRYNSSNPLHHSGIKKISAKGGTPKVEFAVKGVEAYGLTVLKNDIHGDVNNIISDNTQQRYVLRGNQLQLNANATAKIVDINGRLINQYTILENETISLINLQKGIYIIQLIYDDNSTDALKVIR